MGREKKEALGHQAALFQMWQGSGKGGIGFHIVDRSPEQFCINLADGDVTYTQVLIGGQVLSVLGKVEG